MREERREVIGYIDICGEGTLSKDNSQTMALRCDILGQFEYKKGNQYETFEKIDKAVGGQGPRRNKQSRLNLYTTVKMIIEVESLKNCKQRTIVFV